MVAGLLLGMPAIAAGPVQAAPQDMRLATWNMLRSSDRRDGVKAPAENHHVVALQEAPPEGPAGSTFFRRYGNVWVYRWQPTDRGGVRYVSILRHGALSTAMVTAWLPDEWLEVPGVYRAGLALVNLRESTVFARSMRASPGVVDQDAFGGDAVGGEPGGGSQEGGISGGGLVGEVFGVSEAGVVVQGGVQVGVAGGWARRAAFSGTGCAGW